jgi:hypothetical protein
MPNLLRKWNHVANCRSLAGKDWRINKCPKQWHDNPYQNIALKSDSYCSSDPKAKMMNCLGETTRLMNLELVCLDRRQRHPESN